MRPPIFVLALACTLACRPHVTEPTVPTHSPTRPAAPGADATRSLPPGIAKILPRDAGTPSSDSARNLARLPTLGAAHRELLDRHGFFVAPQPTRSTASAGEARTGMRAKHLFQVYERNDYIRFPSFVTVDLAIDLTHQYFDVVLERVEREHLVPRLRTALVAVVKSAEDLHRAARTPIGRAAAADAAVYWGTALRLLEQPASGDVSDAPEVRSPWIGEAAEEVPPPVRPRPRPPRITRLRGELEKRVATRSAQILSASGRGKWDEWGMDIDLTLTKPRAHYTKTGGLQRYFRSMALLGNTSLAIEGPNARLAFVAALLRAYAGAPAAKGLDEVLAISGFVVGEPATTGLQRAIELAAPEVDLRAGTVDAITTQLAIKSLDHAWMNLPEHPIEAAGPVIQPAGARVFADTLAMSALLPIIRELGPDRGDLVARSMGALGSAAALGSDRARDLVVAEAGAQATAVAAAIDRGRGWVGDPGRRDDAYHRTLTALGGLLTGDPIWYDAEAYELRMLHSYAGGWAMLRHDTILYAYQMGAECDAEEQPSPYGWVEPLPKTYAALRATVEAFDARLRAAGIVDPPRREDEFSQFSSINDKTRAIAWLLGKLETWAKLELEGHVFDPDELTEISMVGGAAEHVLLTFADAYELGEGNDDMGIVADVFTWQGQALEVGVAHPELIYALVPSPDGWVVARGAVLGYRELLVGSGDRMTDESWRDRLAKDEARDARPDWLAPITAPEVGVVELPADMTAQSRCEYYGGSFAL